MAESRHFTYWLCILPKYSISKNDLFKSIFIRCVLHILSHSVQTPFNFFLFKPVSKCLILCNVYSQIFSLKLWAMEGFGAIATPCCHLGENFSEVMYSSSVCSTIPQGKQPALWKFLTSAIKCLPCCGCEMTLF